MNIETKIRDYIKSHDYDLEGIDEYLNGHILAASTPMHSCIINIRGYGKYYIYTIKPWSRCPDGKIEIEKMLR